MINFSKKFLNEIQKFASQLGSKKLLIQLNGVYSGFWVSLNDSETTLQRGVIFVKMMELIGMESISSL